MAATEARVVITAQDQTAAAFRTAQNSLNKFGQQTKAMLGGVKGLMAALGAGALAQSVRGVIEMGDEIQKAAVKAGIGGKAMSELAYAAKMSDVELSSLSTALRFMQKNMTEAAAGSKSAQEAFADIGVNLTTLRALQPDRQFEMMAEAISRITDPAERATAVTKLFGKAGADLLPMFEQGAAGLRAAREEAERLGLAFSPEELSTLAAADDAIKRLTASYQGLIAQLAVGAGPQATRLLEELTGLLSGSRQAEMKGAISRLQDIRSGGKLSIALPGVYEDIPGGVYTQAEVQELLTKLQRQYRVLYGASAPGGQGRGRADEMSRMASEQAQKDRDAAKAAEEARKKAIAGLDEIRVTATTRGPSMQEWLRSTESAIEQEVRLWRDRSNDLEAQRAMGMLSEQQYNLRRQELNRQYNDELLGETQVTASKMAATWKESTDSMSVFADQAARNMQDAFAEFLFDPFQGGLRGMLQSFVNTLRRMAAEAAAAQIFGKPGAGGLGDAISGFFKNLFGGGREKGGPVDSRKAYLVGEKGPEMFLPGVSGTILPAEMTKAMQRLMRDQKPPEQPEKPSRPDFTQENSRTPLLDIMRDLTLTKRREDGGPVMQDKPYMVGERGPEMFVPSTGGRIVPSDVMGRGVTVAPVYNVDARGASTDLVKALPAILEANTRRAVEMARAAIYDDYSRGAFGRA